MQCMYSLHWMKPRVNLMDLQFFHSNLEEWGSLDQREHKFPTHKRHLTLVAKLDTSLQGPSPKMLRTLDSRSSSQIPILLLYLMGENTIETKAKVKASFFTGSRVRLPLARNTWTLSSVCFKQQAGTITENGLQPVLKSSSKIRVWTPLQLRKRVFLWSSGHVI